jgi:subtilisin family serine protease
LYVPSSDQFIWETPIANSEPSSSEDYYAQFIYAWIFLHLFIFLELSTAPHHSRMKVLSILLLLLFASSASAIGFVNGIGIGNGNGNDQDIPVEAAIGAIPDEYLVMHDGNLKPQGLLKGLIMSGRAKILHDYTLINCFAVRMKLNALQNALKNIEGVEIYTNDVVTAIAVDSPVGSWGLDRSDQITGTNDQYNYERNGENVDVYILDTGITIEHFDYVGRARHGADFTGEGNYDGHGHGSHVAGMLHSNRT